MSEQHPSAPHITMTDPITVSRNTPAMEIIKLLQERHFIRTPVVEADGKLAGVVSRRDLIQGYLRSTKSVGGF